jgi:hypothetical protein
MCVYVCVCACMFVVVTSMCMCACNGQRTLKPLIRFVRMFYVENYPTTYESFHQLFIFYYITFLQDLQIAVPGEIFGSSSSRWVLPDMMVELKSLKGQEQPVTGTRVCVFVCVFVCMCVCVCVFVCSCVAGCVRCMGGSCNQQRCICMSRSSAFMHNCTFLPSFT